jgi:phospholipase C
LPNKEAQRASSQLQFLEKVTGVTEPNISAWRRQTFGDLTSAFRFGSRAQPPTLPDTHGSLLLSEYEVSQLPAPTPPGRDADHAKAGAWPPPAGLSAGTRGSRRHGGDPGCPGTARHRFRLSRRDG